MAAYYNENDPFAAEWLRQLIAAGHIATGFVDERSIEDVKPDELAEYTQCHFFAGIGGWSLALRLAGVPDDYPIWTGSCPCQPFSTAGKGGGFDDERHLWPAFHWLIQQRRPSIVVGEQVASKATEHWFDLVQTDMEAMDYAFGLVPFPAASIGAPHIRDRAYWMGNSISQGLERHARHGNEKAGRTEQSGSVTKAGSLGGLGDRNGNGSGRHPGTIYREKAESSGERGKNRAFGDGPADAGEASRPGPTSGQWRDADWLYCRDGKWRPVEPGTFPLADGVSNPVGKLRGYGNAIVPAQAAAFIEAAGIGVKNGAA